MKQYDKVIFVPDDEYGHYYVKGDKDPTFRSQRYTPHFNAIVVSLEELKNLVQIVWDEAQFSISKDNGEDMSDVENEGDIAKSAPEFLSTYLQSKGILI